MINQTEIDTFLAEPDEPEGLDEFIAGTDSSPNIGSNWGRLLGGLDGMDSRLSAEERQTFQNLDLVSGNPKQGRAQAINQAWIKANHPEIDHANMELNWPTIRTAYAKQEFGSLEPDVSDVTLYGLISKRHMEGVQAENLEDSTVKAWSWKQDVAAGARAKVKALESFWESINKPAWELPRAPDNLPDMPGYGMINPAVAAGVYNGLAPLIEGVAATPLGIATLGAAAPLHAAAKAQPLAKAALLGMEGIFTALMGYGTYKGAKELPAVFKDPDSTLQERVTKATEVVASGAMTVLGALGTAFTAFEPKTAVRVAKAMEGKTPKEAADILRAEAETLETPAQQKPVLDAANKLEKLSPPEQVKPKEEIDPSVLSEENKGVVTPIEGGYVVTDAQGRLIDYAETRALADEIAVGRKPKVEAKPKEEAETVKGEPVEEGKTIGISNEAVNRELAEMGEAPLKEADYKSQISDVEGAFKKLKDKPDAGKSLIEELRVKSRPLTSDEGALLLAEMKLLKEERAAARQAEVEAKAMGDTITQEQARLQGEEAQRQFNEAARVSKDVGTLGGRGLAFRNVLLKEDNSLATLESRRADTLGVEKLTPEQSKEVADLHARLESAENALAARRARPSTPKEPSRILKAITEQATKARERIAARLKEGRVQSGLDPADIADHAIVGAEVIAKGVTKFADWSVEMVKEFGEKIRPHLAEIFAKSNALKKDETRLEAKKTRLKTETETLKKKVGEKDFEPKEKPKPLHLDEEANRLQAERDMIKLEYENLLERDRYDKLSTGAKTAKQALNVYDTARLLMTTGEMSFILRQGKGVALSHPIMTAKALPDAFRALVASPAEARAMNLKVMNHPDFPAAREAKLHIMEPGQSLNKTEEFLIGNKLGEKIPIVGRAIKGFEQAATVFLNRIRFDAWRAMKEAGGGLNPAEQRQLAMFVNESTGRGGLGSLESAAVPLARLMFSPRYFASRLQIAVGHSLWGGSAATRRIIAKEYARTLVGLGVYYSLIKLAMGDDAEIGTDPRSSDFGKVRMGNTRLDPMAGISQVVTFAARTATGEKTTTKGRTHAIRGEDVPFGADRWSDVALNFGRSKLHPVPGAIVNLFDGTDLAGQKADIANQALNMSAPITYEDIYEALQEQDLPEGVALSLLALLGEGLQTYDTTKSTKPPPTTRRE